MATTITSYAGFQAYLTGILTKNVSPGTGNNEEADSENAPHGDFWNTLSYDQFVNGNVPNVPDPTTGKPIPILVKGNADQSNIILALKGEGALFGPSGSIGQMPGDGPPFLTAEQIQPISDWINANCPEGNSNKNRASSRNKKAH